MKVAVVGAGVVGVATAHELACSGHEVTVIERRSGVAAEASFAQAGVAAPGLAVHDLARRLLGGRGAGPANQASWWANLARSLKARRASDAAKREPLLAAMHHLAQRSHDRLSELTRAHQWQYEQQPGCLLLIGDDAELKATRKTLVMLSDLGVVFELLDAERCRQLEPALHAATPLRCGIRLAQGGVGNARQGAHLLKNEAQRMGVQFLFETVINRVQPGTRPQLHCAAGSPLEFDAVVLCSGNETGLLREVGARLPLVAVGGLSVTAPLSLQDGAPDVGPRAAVIEARSGIAITRLGQRLRVAGGRSTSRPAGGEDPEVLRELYRCLDAWFPGAAVTRKAQHWSGARPTLPDGLPAIGAAAAPGVWLNLGHGGHGWALACGAAALLADLLSRRDPGFDSAPLGLQRFR